MIVKQTLLTISRSLGWLVPVTRYLLHILLPIGMIYPKIRSLLDIYPKAIEEVTIITFSMSKILKQDYQWLNTYYLLNQFPATSQCRERLFLITIYNYACQLQTNHSKLILHYLLHSKNRWKYLIWLGNIHSIMPYRIINQYRLLVASTILNTRLLGIQMHKPKVILLNIAHQCISMLVV